MNAIKLLSSTERTILLTLTFLICLSFYKDLENKIIDSYNESVRIEELKKMPRSNGKEQFHFTIYDCSRSISIPEMWIGLQIIFAPILILLINSKRIGDFVFSLILNFVTFFSYFAWAFNAYWSRLMNESYRLYENTSFGAYLFPQSSVLQQLSFVLVSVLLFLHLFVLVRFTAEKLDSKFHLA